MGRLKFDPFRLRRRLGLHPVPSPSHEVALLSRSVVRQLAPELLLRFLWTTNISFGILGGMVASHSKQRAVSLGSPHTFPQPDRARPLEPRLHSNAPPYRQSSQ